METLHSFNRKRALGRGASAALLPGSLFLLGIGTALGQPGAGPWPMFRHDVFHTGAGLHEGPGAATLSWSYVTGAEVFSSPAVGTDGLIYAGSLDNRVYCLDSTGSLAWSYVTGLHVRSSPAIGSDGRVYVGSLDKSLYSFGDPALGFEVSWTDQFGETIYTIAGPGSAFVGEAFQVTITASDPLYPDVMVAAPWNFKVDAAVHDSGFSIFLAGGVWSRTYIFSYPAAGSHDFLFSAQDLGHGNGSHNWEWFEIGGTTEVIGEATNTPTLTATVSPSPTITPTATVTATPSVNSTSTPTLTPTVTPTPLLVRVNFQPDWSETPAGYYKDSGGVFGEHQGPLGGQAYGWR